MCGTFTLRSGRRVWSKKVRGFIFCVGGTRPGLPHGYVTQSNSICKSKLAFFLCVVYQSAAVCTSSQWCCGLSFSQSKLHGHCKEKAFFLQLDIGFRENKLLKKWIFFGKISCTEHNVGIQKLQLRYIKVVIDILLKPWQSGILFF